MKKEQEFKLIDSVFEVSIDGQFMPAKYLLLKAPSYKHLKSFGKVKQLFMIALKAYLASLPKGELAEKAAEAKKAATEDKNEDMEVEQVLSIIYMGDIDIGNLFDLLEGLFCDGCCLVNGRARMTATLLEDMEASECERLMGEYIANFILPFQTTEGHSKK